MEIISEFVREQKRYAKNDLKKIFRLPQNDVDDFTRNLKAFGILKAVKNNSEQRERDYALRLLKLFLAYQK